MTTMKQKYTYWKDEEMWLGYLDEFPDYWTQAETEQELKENLIDIPPVNFPVIKLGWLLPVVGSDGVNATSCGCRTKASLENLQEQSCWITRNAMRRFAKRGGTMGCVVPTVTPPG
jgi:hypothetical protein